MPEKILLLSAYDAQSHKQWRHELENMFPEYDWVQLALPPRYFSWRVRGNSLSWGLNEKEILSQNFQALIVTSMVDLASLRGFIPSLALIPTMVYFHENQFAYPVNQQRDSAFPPTLLDAQLVSIYSALCADVVVFNSEFNKQSFLKGVQGLLKKLPDHVPSGIIDRLTQARVVPVPLPGELFQRTQADNDPTTDSDVLKVAWNHRWEYDKGPELLLQTVEEVCQRQLPVQFFIFGQQFREHPSEFELIKKMLSSQANSNHVGYIDNRQEYFAMLQQCDVVLSTSRHDFQGLAVLEAVALGCTPLTPNDLVYPEYLSEEFTYDRGNTTGDNAAVDQIAERLATWLELKSTNLPLPKTDMSQFEPGLIEKGYLALINKLIQNQS